MVEAEESGIFETTITKEGICYTVVKPNAVISIDDAVKNTETVRKISKGKVYPMLVDIRSIRSIDKEARDHFSMRNRTPGVKAIGMLVKSPASKVIGNFFLGLNRPIVPTKLFTSERRAIEWLKKI